jgi:hypothetical protein
VFYLHDDAVFGSSLLAGFSTLVNPLARGEDRAKPHIVTVLQTSQLEKSNQFLQSVTCRVGRAQKKELDDDAEPARRGRARRGCRCDLKWFE